MRRTASGLLAGIALSILSYFAIKLNAQDSQDTISSNANGRYQIVINPHVRADTFLLDTLTGNIWVPTKLTDYLEEPILWLPQEIVGINARRVALLEYTPKTSNKSVAPAMPVPPEPAKGSIFDELDGSDVDLYSPED